MASYQKRGKNSFLLVVETGYDASKVRDKETKTIRVPEGLTPKKLKDFLNDELVKFKNEIEAGTYIAPGKMTFKAFAAEWTRKFINITLEEKSKENYLFHTNKRILPYFGDMRIDQIKPMHIMDFLEKLSDPSSRMDGKKIPLGQASIVYNNRVLNSIFSKAKEWKVIKTSPMEGLAKPKESDKEMEVYDETEVRVVLEALQSEQQKLRILISLALTGGMRRAELLGLEPKHIDLEKRLIDIKQSIPIFVKGVPVVKPPKTKGSIRKIAIPPAVIEDIRTYLIQMKKDRLNSEKPWLGGDHQFIFAQDNGIPYYPKILSQMWRDFHKRLQKQIPGFRYIRFHDLRHTSATLLINQGVHAKIISSRLGHSKITTTMNRYGHVIESADRAAAESLNSLFEPMPKNNLVKNKV